MGAVEVAAETDHTKASSLVRGMRGRRWMGWMIPLSEPIGGSAGVEGMEFGLV